MSELNYSKYKYEKVWESSDRQKTLYARLFDPKTNTSFIEEVKNPDKYTPKIFKETEKNSPYRSFNHGKNLEQVHIKDRRALRGFLYDYNIEREERKKFDAPPIEYYGDTNVNYEFIRNHWPDSLGCNHDVRVLWIDIETRSGGVEDGVKKQEAFPKPEIAEYTITTIQLYDNVLESFIILGLKPWDGEYKSELGPVKYLHFDSEVQMLEAFLSLLKKLNPTVIAGFNSNMFDLPYLYNRMNNLGLNGKLLSPIGVVKDSSYDFRTKSSKPLKLNTQDKMEYFGIDIEGVYCLDYRDLVLKYGFLGISSYSLHNVAEAYGLEGKVDHSNYSSFDGFYTGDGYIFPETPPEDESELEIYNAQLNYKNNPNPQTKKELDKVTYNHFMDYSIRDVEVMIEIDKKAKLINTAKSIAYICGVNYGDVTGTLKQWQNYIFNDGFKHKNIISLHQQDSDAGAVYKAGFTTSKPGLHKYVLSVDAASMYPNIFQTGNIGADTLVREEDLPDELRQLRSKYFNFFTMKNFAPGGILDTKYDGETNDIIEEKEFFHKIINAPEISEACKKYNVTVSPNGAFYRKDKESASARAMRENIQARYSHKYKGIELEGELEKIKTEMKRRGIEP